MGGGPTDQAEVFVGVGAVVDVTAGTINTDDAIGLDADVDELTLAIVTTGGTSPVSYTGLSISESVREPGRDRRPGREGDRGQRAGQHGRRPGRRAARDRRPARLGRLHAGRAASATSPRWAASADDVSLHADGHLTVDLFGFVAVDASFS